VSAVRAEASSKGVKKVVLAYSGGLDTSVILKWLQDTYNCEVVTFTADLGQVRGQRSGGQQTRSTQIGSGGCQRPESWGCDGLDNQQWQQWEQ
jgi:hypothetical protein